MASRNLFCCVKHDAHSCGGKVGDFALFFINTIGGPLPTFSKSGCAICEPRLVVMKADQYIN